MSDTLATWPDPSRPGVPLHPERDGWHWFETDEGDFIPYEWRTNGECERGRWPPGWIFDAYAELDPKELRYLGPALTPAEYIAAVAAAFDNGARAMREVAARDVGCGCDNRDAVVSARSNAERSRLCGRAPCAALLAMDVRMLPLPAMEEKPGEPVIKESLSTDAAAIRRAALEEAARVADLVVECCAKALVIMGQTSHHLKDAHTITMVATNIAAAIRALAAKEPGNG
jgi:hypothetical protein